MQSDFDIAESYRRLASGWLWVVGIALIGGLLGLLISSLRPPLYEATAVVGIGIDRTRAEVPDAATVRQAYGRVRALLLADDTLQRAVSLAAQRSGESPSPASSAALEDRIRLSERPDGWVLAALGTDPVETESIVQAWAEVSMDRLEVASAHALRAAEWQRILYEANCRLVPRESSPPSARWLCQSAPPEGDADSIPASILAEAEASRGILPVLTYSLLQGSAGTAEPVVWGRGSLVLGGAMLGLVVGVVLVVSWRRPRPA